MIKYRKDRKHFLDVETLPKVVDIIHPLEELFTRNDFDLASLILLGTRS